MGNRIIIRKNDNYELFKIVNSKGKIIVFGRYSYKNERIDYLFDSNMNLIIKDSTILIKYEDTHPDIIINVSKMDYSTITSHGDFVYCLDNLNISSLEVKQIVFDDDI